MLIYTTEEIIRLAKIVHGDKYDYSKVVYINSKTRIIIICPIHGEFLQLPMKHLKSKYPCPKCNENERSGRRMSNNAKFIKKGIQIYGDIHDYSKVDYKGSKKYVIIIDKLTNTEFKITASEYLRVKRNHTTFIRDAESFINKSNIVHNFVYSYIYTKYINSKLKVDILCKHHGLFQQLPSEHIRGKGCPECGKIKAADKIKNNLNKFLMQAHIIHGDFYIYDYVDFINTYVKVNILCPLHGMFSITPKAHVYNRQGCPVCNKSKGEMKILNILNKFNLNNVQEFKFKNSKLRYDFYLSDLNLLIEYDGRQHFEAIEVWGGIKGLNERIKNDKIKDEMAKKAKIPLLRIPYHLDKELEHLIIKFISIHYMYCKDGLFFRNVFKLIEYMKIDDWNSLRDFDKYKTIEILASI